MVVGGKGPSGGTNWTRRAAEAERDRPVTEGSAFTTTVRYNGGIALVAVSGELDPATAPLLIASIHAMVGQGQRHIVVDLDDVVFIDGAGLGGLESIATLPAVTLIRFSPPVRQLVSQFSQTSDLHDAATETGQEAPGGPPSSPSD